MWFRVIPTNINYIIPQLLKLPVRIKSSHFSRVQGVVCGKIWQTSERRILKSWRWVNKMSHLHSLGFYSKWNPFLKKKRKGKEKGTVAGLAHNLNWKLDAEQVFLLVVSQFPLHNQPYLEIQKRSLNKVCFASLTSLKRYEEVKGCGEGICFNQHHQTSTERRSQSLINWKCNTC